MALAIVEASARVTAGALPLALEEKTAAFNRWPFGFQHGLWLRRRQGLQVGNQVFDLLARRLMPVQHPQRTFHAVGERRTAAVPAVGSCVLHAEKRFGPLEVANAVARQ